MTQEMVRALSDHLFKQVEAWVREERAHRDEERKRETIAKIKELASAVSLSVTINHKRGRPSKARTEATTGKLSKA